MIKKIKIGYKTYTIRETDKMSDVDTMYGRCDHAANEIVINKGQHNDEKPNTLMHEILHGVFYTMGMNNSDVTEQEEYIVNTMSNGIMQVFMDNPHLLEYIQRKNP